MYIFFGREIEEISAGERIRTNYTSKKAVITVIPCQQRLFSCCLLTGEKRPLPWVENDCIEHAPRLSDRAITQCSQCVTKTNFELLQFVVVVEQLQLHLNSFELFKVFGRTQAGHNKWFRWPRDFSAFSFVQQQQQSGHITEIRGFQCAFGKHANVSRPFKIERSI